MDCLNGFKVNHAAVQFYHSKMSGSLVLGKQDDGHGCVGVFIKEKQTHFSVAEQHQQNERISLHELSLFGRNWLNILPIQSSNKGFGSLK